MKKLMIVAAVAMAAVASQAMTFSWSTTAAINQHAAGAPMKGVTAYLIDANDAVNGITQQALLNLYLGGSTVDLSSYAFQTLTTGSGESDAGKLPSTTWGKTETNPDAKVYKADGTTAYAAGEVVKAYFVVVDSSANAIFFSTTANKTLADSGTMAFAPMATMSTKAISTATTVAATGGWYAVPEPTSGLLLLLGVAGLALKRKRA